MGVNSLPKTVTRQRRSCDLNPGPSAPESSTLTTRLPGHPTIIVVLCAISTNKLIDWLYKTNTIHLSVATVTLRSKVSNAIYRPSDGSAEIYAGWLAGGCWLIISAFWKKDGTDGRADRHHTAALRFSFWTRPAYNKDTAIWNGETVLPIGRVSPVLIKLNPRCVW